MKAALLLKNGSYSNIYHPINYERNIVLFGMNIGLDVYNSFILYSGDKLSSMN